MGTLHLRQSTSSWLKERGHALSLPEQQQQQQQRDFLQRPASETPFGGPAMRQLEVLPPMKRSASADSLPAVPTEDVSHPHAIVLQIHFKLLGSIILTPCDPPHLH